MGIQKNRDEKGTGIKGMGMREEWEYKRMGMRRERE